MIGIGYRSLIREQIERFAGITTSFPRFTGLSADKPVKLTAADITLIVVENGSVSCHVQGEPKFVIGPGHECNAVVMAPDASQEFFILEVGTKMRLVQGKDNIRMVLAEFQPS